MKRNVKLIDYLDNDWCKDGKTRLDFANILGISRSYLSRLERGIRRPSPELAKKMERISNGKLNFYELLGVKPLNKD